MLDRLEAGGVLERVDPNEADSSATSVKTTRNRVAYRFVQPLESYCFFQIDRRPTVYVPAKFLAIIRDIQATYVPPAKSQGTLKMSIEEWVRRNRTKGCGYEPSSLTVMLFYLNEESKHQSLGIVVHDRNPTTSHLIVTVRGFEAKDFRLSSEKTPEVLAEERRQEEMLGLRLENERQIAELQAETARLKKAAAAKDARFAEKDRIITELTAKLNRVPLAVRAIYDN